MAEVLNPDTYIIKVESKNYEPYAGIGSSDLLGKDGFFSVFIEKAQFDMSGPEGAADRKPMLLLSCVVQDEDEKGKRINRNVAIGGNDKNGNSMFRQFLDVLHSIGSVALPDGSTLDVARFKTLDGTGLSVRSLMDIVTGKTAYTEVSARTFIQNAKAGETAVSKTVSEITNFIAKDRYEAAQKSGTARKPHAVAQGSNPPAGFVAGGVPMAGGPTITSPAAPNGLVMQANAPALGLAPQGGFGAPQGFAAPQAQQQVQQQQAPQGFGAPQGAPAGFGAPQGFAAPQGGFGQPAPVPNGAVQGFDPLKASFPGAPGTARA